MKKIRILSLITTIFGLLILFSSPLANITGFTIVEEIPYSLNFFRYAFGLILVLFGVAFRAWDSPDEIPLFEKMWQGKPPKQVVRESSRSNNTTQDNHARYVYRQLFKKAHSGRKPTDSELHEFMAHDHHQYGKISEIVEAFDADRYNRA